MFRLRHLAHAPLIRLLITLALPLTLCAQPPAEIHGHVMDASSNEPLGARRSSDVHRQHHPKKASPATTDPSASPNPLFDPRLLANGTVFFAPNSAPWANSQRGYGRGAQIMVQRRTANGFTGWVSYAYGVAQVDDGVLHLTFPTDNDQRHTVNVFGSYRLRPTVNLSMKWLYGSGLPIPGFYRLVNGQYYLSANRNQLRLLDYQRVDVRMNKEWAHDKWKTKSSCLWKWSTRSTTPTNASIVLMATTARPGRPLRGSSTCFRFCRRLA